MKDCGKKGKITEFSSTDPYKTEMKLLLLLQQQQDFSTQHTFCVHFMK
jgi:hypothetical protein